MLRQTRITPQRSETGTGGETLQRDAVLLARATKGPRSLGLQQGCILTLRGCLSIRQIGLVSLIRPGSPRVLFPTAFEPRRAATCRAR